MAVDDLSRRTAEVAVRLLGAHSAYALQPPGRPIFDWRELQRWDIPESRLPPGSLVRYRTPSLWSAYRGTVLSAVGVLVVHSLRRTPVPAPRASACRERQPEEPGARR